VYAADGTSDALVQVLHRYKYGRECSLAPVLSRVLLAAPPLAAAHDLIIPVPLHRERLRWRGFNQAVLLARPLARARGIPLDVDALCRHRPTQPQAGLAAVARRPNMRGAFSVRRREAVAGRSILLVDDVYTTGATVNECARVLRGAGARRVDVLVLARAILQ
jgi:ComF family protein